MTKIDLRLFGEPLVRVGDQRLHFPTRKAQALLIYLAVEGGLHSRETLTALFWPESDAALGRAALRNTLARLRTTLTSAHEPASTLLRFDGNLIGLADNGYMTDLQSLTAALNASAPVAALAAAVTHYGGDFLTGFGLDDAPDFDNWASRQREQWHQALHAIFDRLTRHYTDTGSLTAALPVTQQWCAHDLLHEPARQRLMQLYLALENRTAALQVYETFRQHLQSEWQMAPSAALVALADRARQEDRLRREFSRTETGRQEDKKRSPAAPPTSHPITQSLSHPARTNFVTPFVGRGAEFTQLLLAFRQAQQGELQVVLLEGEAGIGKTRLANEFLTWVRLAGSEPLWGRAFETGGRLPYQPVTEALRRRLEQVNAPDDLLSDLWLAELSRLLPELRERYPDLPPPGNDESTAQVRLYEALHRLLQALATDQPIVFWLDDLQWADVASLGLWQYLFQQSLENRLPLLLLGAVRSDLLADPGLAVARELTTWLPTLLRAQRLHHLVLTRLADEAIFALIEQVQDRAYAASAADWQAFAHWLTAESQGQPFHLVEYLRMMMVQGALATVIDSQGQPRLTLTGSQPALSRQGAPPTVRALITAQIAQLSPAGAALLLAGAVLGDGFTFDNALAVAASEENAGLVAAEELTRRGLLRESGATFFFSHDRIREQVYADASATRRRVFHRRALAAVEGQAAAAQLARHALAADLPERAIALLTAAGDDAMRLSATRDAVEYYQQAYQLLHQRGIVSPASVSEYAPLFLQLGRAYELLNQWSEAQTIYEELLGLVRTASQPIVEVAVLNRLATLTAWQRFDMKAAHGLLAQAQSVAESAKDARSLAETFWNLAQIKMYTFDPTAIGYGEQALALARTLNDRELLARCLNVLAHIRFSEWDVCLTLAEEACQIYQQLNHQAMVIDCLVMIGLSHHSLGNLQQGLTIAQQAATLSRQVNQWCECYTAFLLALVTLSVGQKAEAQQAADRSVTLADALGFPALQAVSRIAACQVYAAFGQLSLARTYGEAALAANERLGNPPIYIDTISANLCAICVAQADWPAAAAYAYQAWAAQQQSRPTSADLPRHAQVVALLHQGDHETAQQLVNGLIAAAHESPRLQLVAARTQAELAHGQGEDQQAITHLQNALTLAKQIGLPGEQAVITAQLAAWEHHY